MMLAKVLALAVLSQNYNRSLVTDGGLQCLWWQENTTITWHMDSVGNPVTSPGCSAENALQKAFGTWQAQMDVCGSLGFAEGAATASRKVGYFETGTNENIVLFRNTVCSVPKNDRCLADDNCGNVYDCWQFSDKAIAITTTSFAPSSGRILDSDIELNNTSYTFTTVDAPRCSSSQYQTDCVATDVQNTATHEIGHLLGLAHFPVSSSTMSASANPGELDKRTLDPGTRQFVCDVYPKGAISKTCVTPVLGNEVVGKAGCQVAPAPLWGVLLVAFGARRPRRRG